MKAIQYSAYGGPEVLELVDIDEPAPAPGQVLVDVHAASVNPVDWKIRRGMLKAAYEYGFPSIPGRDASGVVAALGEGVDDFAVGDAVCLVGPREPVGTFVERFAVDTELVAAKPARLDHIAAAAFPLAGLTAWCALVEYAGVMAGLKVLVHAGAGGVGGLAVQLAGHLGAEVAATCSAANADYVAGLGASRVIAYDKEDFTEALSDIDVVLDTMGGEVHRRSYQVMKRGGMLVVIRAAPIEDLSEQYGVEVRMSQMRADDGRLRTLAQLVEDGALEPQVGTVMTLAEAAEAHRLSETGHARGKIVLTLR